MMLKFAWTYELFFRMRSWVTGFVTRMSSNVRVASFIEMYGYLPTALNRYTRASSP